MTNNHDYNTPAEGTSDWHVPINENFERIDTDVEIRDKDSNKGSYEPKDGAKFFATDTGDVYLGDGSSWNAVAVGTSSNNPSFESVDAKESYVNSRQEDITVYQDSGTTRAIGRSGVVDSGSNPSSVIESAIQNGRHVTITGDYTLNEKITVTQDNRVIDASGATFTAGGDNKLWEFNNVNACRFTSGVLDLGTVGRIALDVKGTWSCEFNVYLKSVPDGTFDADGNTNDRCGIRFTRANVDDGRGSFWNTLRVSNVFHNEGVGIGMQFDGGNGNFITGAKVMNYRISLDIPAGTGNTFVNLDVSYSKTGVRQTPGTFGSFNDTFGFTWAEHCDTAFDVATGNDVNCKFGLFGRYSKAGTDTVFTNRQSMVVFDYWQEELLMGKMGLSHHKEGSTGSNPANQSPDGWLEIQNQNGNTKYVPYYS